MSSDDEIIYVEPYRSAHAMSPEGVRDNLDALKTMPTEAMRRLARRHGVHSCSGRKALLQNLRAKYRVDWASHVRRNEERNVRFKTRTSYHYDYLVFIDIECTCVEVLDQFPHEIIELPAVLYHVNSRKIVDTFQTFVKPIVNSRLDEFCMSLCNISQQNVDNAPGFPLAFRSLLNWLAKHDLLASRRFAFVTDGPCDFAKFLQFQCLLLDMKLPHIFRKFINLKKIFEEKVKKLDQKGKLYVNKRPVTSLEKMLEHYEMRIEGKSHCGLDDARNLARLATRMMDDGIALKINQHIVLKDALTAGQQLQNIEKKRARNASASDYERQNLDRELWDFKLPYRARPVHPWMFYTESYDDCDSCDERDCAEFERRSAAAQPALDDAAAFPHLYVAAERTHDNDLVYLLNFADPHFNALVARLTKHARHDNDLALSQYAFCTVEQRMPECSAGAELDSEEVSVAAFRYPEVCCDEAMKCGRCCGCDRRLAGFSRLRDDSEDDDSDCKTPNYKELPRLDEDDDAPTRA